MIYDPIDFLVRWYDSHIKVSIEEIEYWSKYYPYSGIAYRITAMGGTYIQIPGSWSKSVEALEWLVNDVDPYFNGADVGKARLAKALNLQAMVKHYLKYARSSTIENKIDKIYKSAEIVNLGKIYDFEYVGKIKEGRVSIMNDKYYMIEEVFVKYNPVGKLTRAQKNALVDILKEKPINLSSEVFYELLHAKYIQPDKWGDTYELTELGKEIAESESKLKEQAKTKTRAAARARYGAMSGLGLKKTKYGGWE